MNTKHKQRTDLKTESITPEERTKGSDRYKEDNQGGDGVQVSVIMRVTLVTGVRHNEQPGNLEAGEGARDSPLSPTRGSSRRTPTT